MIGEMQRGALIWYGVMTMAAGAILSSIWDFLPTAAGDTEVTPQRLYFVGCLLAIATVAFVLGRCFTSMQTSFFERVESESSAEEYRERFIL